MLSLVQGQVLYLSTTYFQIDKIIKNICYWTCIFMFNSSSVLAGPFFPPTPPSFLSHSPQPKLCGYFEYDNENTIPPFIPD